jgi:hypothetical protein
MSPAPEDVTLFRYTDPDAFGDHVTLDNIQDQLPVGSEYVDKSFQSAGVNLDDLMYYSRPLSLQIEAPKGTPMVYAGYNTANEEDEGEMILGDGLRYQVLGVWRSPDDGSVTVRVRVVS